MKLNHIAFSIKEQTEVVNFYQNVLEMEMINNFTLTKSLSSKIFGKEHTPSVFLLKKDELYFEIFVSKETQIQNYNHICIKIENREELFEKAKKNRYKCYRKKRDKPDLMFIYDKSGNVFEIKE